MQPGTFLTDLEPHGWYHVDAEQPDEGSSPLRGEDPEKRNMQETKVLGGVGCLRPNRQKPTLPLNISQELAKTAEIPKRERSEDASAKPLFKRHQAKAISSRMSPGPGKEHTAANPRNAGRDNTPGHSRQGCPGTKKRLTMVRY